MHAGDLRPARARQFSGARVSSDALSLAVIIPALDEAGALAGLLSDLQKQQDVAPHVIVVDGGSHDETPAIARAHGADVVQSSPGRGTQMNVGRGATHAEWLLFLHADTRLEEPHTLSNALIAIGRAPRQCGHFALRFRDGDGRLRFLEAKTELSRPYTTNGDQGILVNADFFDELGGFDERLGFLEDQRFARAARAAGATWITLPDLITTSARRFATEGFGRRYLGMAIIMAAWAGGADEFFDAAPSAYLASPTSKLDIDELLRAIRVANRRMGLRRTRQTWLRAARFARSNLWQAFFAADVALADELPHGEHPFLDLYDRRIAGHIDNAVVDSTIAATAFVTLTRLLPAARAAQRGANWVRMRMSTPKTTTATAT